MYKPRFLFPVLVIAFASLACLSVNQKSTPPVEVQVFANQGWQYAQVNIKQGETVTIKVISGQWTNWKGHTPYNSGEGGKYICGNVASNCVEPLPSFPSDGLIGRIGSQIFGVGNGATIVANQASTLYLRMNDGDNGLQDNDGSLIVRITQGK